MADTDDKSTTPADAPADKPATDPSSTPDAPANTTPAAGDNADSTPVVPTTPSGPSAETTPDEISFKDQGVFYANMLEVIRVLNVVAKRVVAVEGKVGGGASGGDLDPAIKALPGKVSDMQDAEKAMKADIDALKDEVKKLGFPDDGK